MLKRVKNDYPAEWNVVLQKWDPNGEYRTKFEAKFGKRLEIWESQIYHSMMSDGNINFSTEIQLEVLGIPRNMEFFDVEEG